MGYTYKVFPNQKVDAYDLNKLWTYFASGGVSPVFANGETFPVTAINDENLNLVAGGVAPTSDATCRVTKTGDGTVLISSGVAFFDNGTTIEIDSSGEVLNYTVGEANYIYLKSSMSEMKAYPVCTQEVMENKNDDYYVLLAEISAAGVITDKRKYAKGKIPGMQSTAFAMLEIDDMLSCFEEKHTDAEEYPEFVVYNKLPVGANNYTNLLIYYGGWADLAGGSNRGGVGSVFYERLNPDGTRAFSVNVCNCLDNYSEAGSALIFYINWNYRITFMGGGPYIQDGYLYFNYSPVASTTRPSGLWARNAAGCKLKLLMW